MITNISSFCQYQRPGGVVFLDDDQDYLEMLAMVMPKRWFARFFVRPQACIDALLKEPPLWEADAWLQQEIINKWRDGAMLIPQILQYWREDGTKRFGLTQVCVVDYSMPAMTGLSVLSELAAWKPARVLLTGRADEQIALSAFNRGLIDRFIPKQTPDIGLTVISVVDGLMMEADDRRQQIWRASLSLEQYNLLNDPAISKELQSLVTRQSWIEYVVIGDPFGLLALDAMGGVHWLKFVTSRGLAAQAVEAAAMGIDPSQSDRHEALVDEIRVGAKLLNLELRDQLGQEVQPYARNTFPITASVGGEVLYTALFPVNESMCPGVMNSYERFLATDGHRDVID